MIWMWDDMSETNIKKVYLARTRDENLWKESSSGGVFWYLVEYIVLELKGVCYGARFDTSLNVVHSRAETLEDAEYFRGSKYVQSDMKGCYHDILEDLKSKRVVLFSGTPCQVQAVKKFIPDYLQENLVLVDILCHGTPSPLFFRDYIHLLEKTYHSKAKNVKFRGKRLRGSVQDMYVEFESGKTYKSFGTHDIFYKFFFHEFISRESCAKCPFASEKRISDITISDFWGDMNAIPDSFYGMLGLSGVYINSTKGNVVWKSVKEKILVEESDIQTCDQPTLHHPIEKSPKREEFWKLYRENGILNTTEYYFGNYKKMCFMRILKNALNESGLLAIIRKIRRTHKGK